jgi:hypothetical protein
MGLNCVGAVPDDHGDRSGTKPTGSLDDVCDHRPAGDGVKHLWKRRLHSRTLAGGKNHDVNV